MLRAYDRRERDEFLFPQDTCTYAIWNNSAQSMPRTVHITYVYLYFRDMYECTYLVDSSV